MSERPTTVIVSPVKSVGIAAVLAFFFGPIGMLYSTIAGAIVMFALNIGALLLTAGIGLLLTWPMGVVWAALAANAHNKRIGSTNAYVQGGGAAAAIGPTVSSAPASSPTPSTGKVFLVGIGLGLAVAAVGMFVYQNSKTSSSGGEPRAQLAAIGATQPVGFHEATDVLRAPDGMYRGAWFQVWSPPGFQIAPSLKSSTAMEGYDSVFFRSPDGQVEFYVYSPQWSGEPVDIGLGAGEKQTSSETKASAANVVTWYSIEARDGSYVRSYQDTRSSDGSTRWVVGIKYGNKAAFEAHQQDYLRFKKSLVQFAD